MANAWLALGANIGDPLAQLETAVARLDAHPLVRVTARSTIIVTAPWGKTDQNDFYNMALAVETDSSPEELLDVCLAIELAMGRERIEHWGPRLIDIDVIAYEREVIDTERLKLPHPFAHQRDFVLSPLREIAPEVADWIVERAAPLSSLTHHVIPAQAGISVFVTPCQETEIPAFAGMTWRV